MFVLFVLWATENIIRLVIFRSAAWIQTIDAGVFVLPVKFQLATSKCHSTATFFFFFAEIKTHLFLYRNRTIFAFVARRSTSSHDNQCHVFCELEPNQPAAAITAFANKVIPSYGAQPYLRDI